MCNCCLEVLEEQDKNHVKLRLTAMTPEKDGNQKLIHGPQLLVSEKPRLPIIA